MCVMEKLATYIYTFSELVRNGFTYIDKTDRLWPLVNLSVIVDSAVERVCELSGVRKS